MFRSKKSVFFFFSVFRLFVANDKNRISSSLSARSSPLASQGLTREGTYVLRRRYLPDCLDRNADRTRGCHVWKRHGVFTNKVSTNKIEEDGKETVLAREREIHLRGVQPLPSRQGETQLRGVQPLPSRQGKKTLRGVQPLSPRQAEKELREVQTYISVDCYVTRLFCC